MFVHSESKNASNIDYYHYYSPDIFFPSARPDIVPYNASRGVDILHRHTSINYVVLRSFIRCGYKTRTDISMRIFCLESSMTPGIFRFIRKGMTINLILQAGGLYRSEWLGIERRIPIFDRASLSASSLRYRYVCCLCML